MEEILLRSDTSQEASIDKATSSGRRVVWQEAGQRLAVHHEWWSSAFQLNLTQQAGDLHAVHLPQDMEQLSLLTIKGTDLGSMEYAKSTVLS